MNSAKDRPSRLRRLELVRCQKPVGAGLREGNPGCPDCYYLGWIKVSAAVGARAGGPSRFGEDPRPRPLD
jgi:hypothetical protein